MATIRTPFPLSGSLGDLIFVHARGKTFLRRKPTFDKQKWASSPRLARSRENAQAFAGASKVACSIYRNLAPWKEILRPYAHNHLIATFTKALIKKGRSLRHIDLTTLQASLQKIDLNRGTYSHFTPTLLPLYSHSQQSPDAPLPSFDILAPFPTHPGPSHRLELRIHVLHISFPEARFDPEARTWDLTQRARRQQPLRSTPWMPTHILRDHISIPLADPSIDQPGLTLIIQEYRQVHNTTGATQPRPDLGQVHLAAIHYLPQASRDQAQPTAQTHTHTQTATTPLWQSDPAIFIRQALAQLGPNTG